MFSSFIRFGIVISGAAMLASCGGSSVAITQQSTPEGLYSGVNSQSQTMLMFVEYNGSFYNFYSEPNNPAVVEGVQAGAMSFGGGAMVATSVLELDFGHPLAATATVINPSFDGGYTTGINVAGTFTYPTVATASSGNSSTVTFNIPYDNDYQTAQNLSKLAGTYTGTVATSIGSESATFTFSAATTPANGGNQFGVATISGVGADGCSYSGTVSPLYKGNGYTSIITSGGAPCTLPNTQFSGLIYLDPTNHLYSFAPNVARTDGLLFTGSRI